MKFLDRKVGRGIRNLTRDLWDISAFEMRVLAHSNSQSLQEANIWFLYDTCYLKLDSWFSLPLFLFPSPSLSLPLTHSHVLSPILKSQFSFSSLSSILSTWTKARMTLGYRTCEGYVSQPSGLCRHNWCSLGLGNSVTIGSPKEGKPGTLCLISEKNPENAETTVKSDHRSGGWGVGLCFLLSALAEELEVR